jgi:hypothetical protein
MNGTDRHRDRTDDHLVVDRAQATWPAGDLHRRAPRQGVLKMQINKSDRNDAAGIARIMQTGWFKEVSAVYL